MQTIDVKLLVGFGFPPEEGETLARELSKRRLEGEEVVLDVTNLPASMLVSSFINSMLQYACDAYPELFPVFRKFRWKTKYEFQGQLIRDLVENFRPCVPA